ncbi:Transmembrane 9 superfamily member 12 [Sesamum angolense]|uniref:Transmembrane 9 superfamily member n=1 Tax=Sesamum angolense TaxID=2727404 RepID=A0AAE2C0E6_9LAMI|nr:Transmembrane 9 superfamily member 12 [Sesamum angolense]
MRTTEFATQTDPFHVCFSLNPSVAGSEFKSAADLILYVPSINYSLGSAGCNGFYLPGSYMHTYSTGDEIYAKVNSLTSIETELPFSYYSLPYCKPKGGIKKSAENLGELLMGDQIDNSPYRFRMNVNESVCTCAQLLH